MNTQHILPKTTSSVQLNIHSTQNRFKDYNVLQYHWRIESIEQGPRSIWANDQNAGVPCFLVPLCRSSSKTNAALETLLLSFNSLIALDCSEEWMISSFFKFWACSRIYLASSNPLDPLQSSMDTTLTWLIKARFCDFQYAISKPDDWKRQHSAWQKHQLKSCWKLRKHRWKNALRVRTYDLLYIQGRRRIGQSSGTKCSV